MFGLLRRLLGKGLALPRALSERLAPTIDPATVEADSAPGSVVSAPRMLTVYNADGTVWHMPIPSAPGSVVSAPRMLTVYNADGTVWHMPIPPDPTDETR